MIGSVYKNLDIKFVEELVESVATVVGVETKKMEVKKAEVEEIIKKIEQAKIDKAPVFVKPVNTDSIRVADSLLVVRIAQANKPKKKLFNSVVDTMALYEAKMRAIAETAEAAKPKKRKLFNSSSDEQVIANSSEGDKNVIKYFQAKIHGAQKFKNDDEVTLRTAQETVINGTTVPANLTFKAKVNIFDERIHFIVKKINDVSLKAENYSNGETGVSISKDIILKEGYLMSDGVDVRFGFSSK
jgi:hypothetical protein